MNLFLTTLTISTCMGLLSIIYMKTFFLSVLISLEIVLLNIIIFNFMITNINNESSFIPISIFILALAAVEASIGISLITLISRNFNENSINNLSLLKN